MVNMINGGSYSFIEFLNGKFCKWMRCVFECKLYSVKKLLFIILMVVVWLFFVIVFFLFFYRFLGKVGWFV